MCNVLLSEHRIKCSPGEEKVICQGDIAQATGRYFSGKIIILGRLIGVHDKALSQLLIRTQASLGTPSVLQDGGDLGVS